ncbi:MAG: hypothetical protein GY835_28085 [bacterium]|nr:hypothetical protein [bacterium]
MHRSLLLKQQLLLLSNRLLLSRELLLGSHLLLCRHLLLGGELLMCERLLRVCRRVRDRIGHQRRSVDEHLCSRLMLRDRESGRRKKSISGGVRHQEERCRRPVVRVHGRSVDDERLAIWSGQDERLLKMTGRKLGCLERS